MEKTLPKGWKALKLEKVIQTISLTGKKLKLTEYQDKGLLPVVDQGQSLIGGYTDKEDLRVCCDLPVIIFGDHTKVFKYIDFQFVAGADGVKVIKPAGFFLPKLFYYFLQVLPLPDKGYTRHFKFLKEQVIPLPPLPVQRKIVEILEEADSLRKLRKQADERMKDLIPSLFVEMFGDPATNPKGWEVKKLGEVCEIRSGGTPSRHKKEYWNGNIPWLGSTVCKDEPVYKAEEFITSSGLEKSAAKIFKPKTTLIALVGATIGKTAFLTFEATTNQNIAGLFPLNTKSLLPEFIFHFSQSLYPQFLNLGEEKFRMANLSFIRGLEIPLPPLPLQQEFAQRVEEIEAEKERQAESKKKLDDLFNSLMQRAFKGELVA